MIDDWISSRSSQFSKLEGNGPSDFVFFDDMMTDSYIWSLVGVFLSHHAIFFFSALDLPSLCSSNTKIYNHALPLLGFINSFFDLSLSVFICNVQSDLLFFLLYEFFRLSYLRWLTRCRLSIVFVWFSSRKIRLVYVRLASFSKKNCQVIALSTAFVDCGLLTVV